MQILSYLLVPAKQENYIIAESPLGQALQHLLLSVEWCQEHQQKGELQTNERRLQTDNAHEAYIDPGDVYLKLDLANSAFTSIHSASIWAPRFIKKCVNPN